MKKTEFISLIKECMQETVLEENAESIAKIKSNIERVSDSIDYCEDKGDHKNSGILKKEYHKLEAQLKQLEGNVKEDVKSDELAFLGGGAENDEEETSIKIDVLKVVEKVVKEYKGGLALDSKEMNYAASEEELDVKRLYLSDVLYERVKNILYNSGKSKESTYIQVNKPLVKDAIIVKLGENPLATTLVQAQPVSVNENIKMSLKKLILESLEEVKEEKEKNNSTIMDGILEDVKKNNKDAILVENDAGNFTIRNCGEHYFDIRPMWKENFNVVYFKDKVDKERKFNLNPKTLKEYVKSKLGENLSYVEKAFNKSAGNDVDETKKVEGRPSHNPTTIKKVTNTKNENKDYTVDAVTEEKDLPLNNPLSEVKTIKKQSDHPVEGEKVKFTPPKQEKKDKAHLVKFKNKKLKV